jgi:hypothetical protein
MMDQKNETQGVAHEARPYESPVIRTHKREDLAARAVPINACTTGWDPIDSEPE